MYSFDWVKDPLKPSTAFMANTAAAKKAAAKPLSGCVGIRNHVTRARASFVDGICI